MMRRKSLCLTYFLWVFGGFLGLHHYYLRRYKHAFVWFCLPGGFYGLGWIRDLWRIPTYVREANEGPEEIRAFKDEIRKGGRPPFSYFRLIGQTLLGNLFGSLAVKFLPGKDEIGLDLSPLGWVLSPIGNALGVWVIGNVGKERGSIRYPLVAAFLTSPIVRVCCLYLSLWGSYMYFNYKVVTSEGDEIKFRDAIKNFLVSPVVQELWINLNKLYLHIKVFGYKSTFKLLLESLDPLGEKNALKTLGLPHNATQTEIKAKYRELSKLWHPDKYLKSHEKSNAHERFLEIQKAYEKLSSIKRERAKKNKS